MACIGKLEQLSLSVVLQGIETYAKTGLLVIKHEAQWVELYFRDGRLMCIGPVRANATLGDRLLQAGIISAEALQGIIFSLGGAQPSETRIALTLMDLGYVSHEGLRAWAMKEASGVLQILLTWPSGELDLEDGQQPSPDRLLVALSPTSLLPRLPVTPKPQPVPSEVTSPVVKEQQKPTLPSSLPAQPAGFISVAELISETPASSPRPSSPVSFASPESPMPIGGIFGGSDSSSQLPLTPPQRVIVPLPPMRIDTSFMRPEMVLLPVDLSGLREQNPRLQLTPEQWRLLTRADGQTSLRSICQELVISPELVCQLAGELMVLGVVQVTMPTQRALVKELSPVSRDLIASGLGNGHVTPGYAATSAQPWAAVTPTTDALPPAFNSTISLETKSQWGNGGNGATFVPGRGWVTAPQPLQPVQPSGLLHATSGVYAQAGVRR